MVHNFHKLIGRIICELEKGEWRKLIEKGELKILKDTACRGGKNDRDDAEMHEEVDKTGKKRQSLPLFVLERKSSATRFTKVDMLIIYRERVKVIIEIEETSVNPVHIFGKFFASALSSFYIYREDNAVPFGDSVLFIQILDASKIIKKSRKPKQWLNIEQTINRIIPVAGSKINRYKIFYGRPNEFSENGEKKTEFVEYLKKYFNYY